MNSLTSPLLDRRNPYDSSRTYQSVYPQYLQDTLWERLGQPSVLVPALVLFLTVVYQASSSLAASRGWSLPAPAKLLWESIVWLLPARPLYAVDSWMNPPLFPRSMLQPGLTTSVNTSHAAKSDVLRKILGIDGTSSIMSSVSRAGRRSLSSLSEATLGFKGDSSQPPGLGNWDNSCYQNSILQGLASLKSLPSYLLSRAAEDDGASKNGAAETLRSLIADLTDGTNNGRTLWTPSVLKNMNTWQQQDAQEYFSKLLDEIDKDVTKAVKARQRIPGLETEPATDDAETSQHSDDSGYQSQSTNVSKASSEPKVTRNPLEGLAAQRVVCTACGHSDGLSLIPFNCLTLDLGTDKMEDDLYERLDSYTRVEPIQGVECAKCTLLKFQRLIKVIIQRSRDAGFCDEDHPEPFARLAAIEAALEEDEFDDKTLSVKCKIPAQQRVSSTKTKQVVVARPPQSLALHMNRSVFDESTGHMFKNLAAVRYPKLLDLGSWCLGSADASTALESTQADGSETEKFAPVAHEEQWVLDPTASMVAGDLHPSKLTGPIYELRAVVTHYGRHENGHYVCYRKHQRGPRRQDDSELEETKKVDRPANLAPEYERDDVSSQGASTLIDDVDEQEAKDHAEDEGDEPQWWRLSDQDVTKVDEETVLSQGGVFMLFYDCVDPNSTTTAQADRLIFNEQPTEKPELRTAAVETECVNTPCQDREGETTKARDEGLEPLGGQVLVAIESNEAAEALRKAQSVPLPDEGDGI